MLTWQEELSRARLIFEIRENKLVWAATHIGYGIDPDTNKIWKVLADGTLFCFGTVEKRWTIAEFLTEDFPQYLHPMTGWQKAQIVRFYDHA